MTGTKISALPNLSAMTDGTYVPVVSSGANYKTTGIKLKEYIAGNLGNLYISDETIGGLITDRDITLTPAGTGLVSLPGLKIPTGSVLQGNSNIVSTIASLKLENVYAYSDATLTAIPPNTYGTHGAIAAPWSVYFFKTTPTPVLQINDNIAGAGIPVPSRVEFVGGVGQYANIVVTNKTYYGLLTEPPIADTTVFTTRAIINAGLNLLTDPSTDIVLNTGANGFVVSHSDILPYTTNSFSLGSPQKRWKEVYIGPSTIYIQDPTTGVDLSIGALSGNLQVSGGNGLTVGKFTLHGNTIALLNSAEDFYLGSTYATANLNINRPTQILSNAGKVAFSVDRTGRVVFYPPTIPASDVGAFSIIGSTTGAYQPVTSAGGMMHITGNDGLATRVSLDNFNNGNTTTSFNAIIARGGRGTAAEPTQSSTNDILFRLAASGYRSDTGFSGVSAGGATTSLDIVVSEPTTNATRGTAFQIFNAPIGSNSRVQSAQFDSNFGISIPTAGLGVKFSDSSFQTTAFIPSQQVASVTLGTGILQQGRLTGNVSIDTVDVHSVVSASTSLTVANVTPNSNNLRLTLAQEIGPSNSPTFANAYVTGNLYVTGNIISGGSNSLNGKILYLANNSTSGADINGGGIQLGANLAAYSRKILYSLTGPNGDYWYTDPDTGFQTEHLRASDAYLSGNMYANGTGYFGGAYNGYTFPNAGLQVTENVNSYAQIVEQNLSNGTKATTDFIATSNNGTDTTFYVDMGIAGSNYDNTNPLNSLGTSLKPNDSYLYAQGNTSATVGGNLIVGAIVPGRVINFIAGGVNASDIIATFSNTSVSVTGNVAASGNVGATFYTGNGYYLTGLPTLSSVTNINANLASLLANAGTQQGQINSISSNVTTLQSQVYSNVNAAAYIPLSSTIVNIQSDLSTLYANATTQENEISGLRANIISANSAISTLQSNVGAYHSFANVWLANLQSNVTTLFSNANFQNTWLSNLQANIGTLNSNITTINNNISGNAALVFMAANSNPIANTAGTTLKNTLHSMFRLTRGVTLTSNTRYQYEILMNAQCSKSGAMSYALITDGNLSQHNYTVISNKTTTIDGYAAGVTMMSQNATGNAAIATANPVADTNNGFAHYYINGTIDVLVGGNVNFMVSQDQNTPVTWTAQPGAYVRLIPISAITGNTSVGTWT